MIMYCEVHILRSIIATGHMKREDLIREIKEAFPQSDLKRTYNNGYYEEMTVMLKSHPTTGKEVEMFCKIRGFNNTPRKVKMRLVRWLYKNGLSTMDANIIADKYIPEVKKAYSTTPVEHTYTGMFAFSPKTIEREVINMRLGYAPEEDRIQTTNPMEMQS